MKRIITFGEIMLRLAPEGYMRFVQADTLGATFGGSVVTENVFTWPGIGQLLVSAIKQRDTTLVCGLLIMSVTMVCICQLLVDLAYAFVDPRLKSQYVVTKKKKEAAKA